MSEPELTYVRGKGWVYLKPSSREFVCRYDGKKYRITIERRAPGARERAWDITKLGGAMNGRTDATDEQILDDLVAGSYHHGFEKDTPPGFGWASYLAPEEKLAKNHVAVTTEVLDA